MRRGLAIGVLSLLPWLTAAAGGAATLTILNADGTGEGFNDPTPRAPVLGNTGTTLGQQRLNAFTAAAAYWSNRLSSSVPITVHAQINPLPCTPVSGILGSAGPTNFFANFPNSPRTDTWYPSALANTLSGADLEPSSPEIAAQFSGLLDSDPNCLTGIDWWYGIGGATPAGTLSFYQVIVHEIAHGLGFLAIVDPTTGASAEGLDDIFMTFLEDHSTGKKWPDMSNAERSASSRDRGDLHWTGTAVQAASSGLAAGRHPSGHVQMYAPSTAMPGSSVSHWDTALTPDEVMEPNLTANPADLLTTQLMKDIGWTVQAAPAGGCTRDANTGCLQSGRFEVKVDWQTATAQGPAQVMSFGDQRTENDESVFWWFFGANNFELGVKVLKACSTNPNSKHWVFVSGLTNQGWTVRVRDTQTGAIKTYSNPVNQLSKTVSDTSAFSCP
ncbi:MAG TPA: hypothetical protein VKK31_22110 [Thermoanaerobaculia bacterium]|nr:hypothetical protein [Thermoanaerobaculia bacterium]